MGKPKVTTDGGSTSGESIKTSSKVVSAGDRKLLKVELRQGETTYVSWKKLMSEARKGNGLSSSVPEPLPNANPNIEFRLEAGAPAENEVADQPHSNRFNSVIEKIERLYMGKDSSDGEELDGAPDDDEYDTEDSFIDDAELDEYFEVDNSQIKHDGFFINRGKLERVEPSTTSNQQPKKRQRKESAKPSSDVVDASRKQAKVVKIAGGKDQTAASGPSSKKEANDSKIVQDSVPLLKSQSGNDPLVLDSVKLTDKANHLPIARCPKPKAAGSSATLQLKYSSKSAHQQSNSLPGNSRPTVLAKSTEVRQKENNGMHDLDIATKKGGSNARPKSSTLEKAIRELEKVVAESRPPAGTETQDADPAAQAVKRRLPRDVKLKLGKVARVAHANQGKISGELINRLNSIVGHLIQIRSLKRNLKMMIDSGNSANREKDTRFQRIKNEITEMLKTQVPLMESQATNQGAGTSDNFQDGGSVEKTLSKKKFVMDAAVEDKLCDLYDIFVEGLDEDAGPQIRKLYTNLADLWPNRLMDNHEIKRAIVRAKERRRAMNGNLGKEMDQMKMTKRKQTQLVPKLEDASDVGDKALASVVPSATSTYHSQPTSDSSCEKSKQQNEKSKGTSSSSNPSAEGRIVKRKPSPGVEEPNMPAEKHLVLALRQQTHPQVTAQAQTQTQAKAQTQIQATLQATPYLNLPS